MLGDFLYRCQILGGSSWKVYLTVFEERFYRAENKPFKLLENGSNRFS